MFTKNMIEKGLIFYLIKKIGKNLRKKTSYSSFNILFLDEKN